MENPVPDISVVAPLFNESANLRRLAEALIQVLKSCDVTFEGIFVDDGSTDDSWETIRSICEADARFSGLSFSRNFGKEIAIAAGLDHARGKAVIIIDADLQHPTRLIPIFIAKWREGYKNVYGQRMTRQTDPQLRNFLTRMFYRLLDEFGDTRLPPGSCDFRLLDRQAVDALLKLRERARFNKGLYAWIGFKSCGVPFDMQERGSGTTKFGYGKLFSFALDGLMSFSALPLKVWTYVGLAVSGLALTMAGYYGFRTLIFGVDVPGYASLIVSIAFFAGMQLISLGVLGEYIARIFDEVKDRPLYLIADRAGQNPQASGEPCASD